MSILSKKTFAVVLTAATLGVGVAATATPAAAWGFHPHHGHCAGLALGTAFAPAYASDCYIERRPVTNRFGRIIGFRRIRVCG